MLADKAIYKAVGLCLECLSLVWFYTTTKYQDMPLVPHNEHEIEPEYQGYTLERR